MHTADVLMAVIPSTSISSCPRSSRASTPPLPIVAKQGVDDRAKPGRERIRRAQCGHYRRALACAPIKRKTARDFAH
jgi:hypothetical protein